MTSKELREKARAYLGASQRLFDAADILDELPTEQEKYEEKLKIEKIGDLTLFTMGCLLCKGYHAPGICRPKMTHDEIIGGSQYSELGTTGLIQDRMGNTYKKTS